MAQLELKAVVRASGIRALAEVSAEVLDAIPAAVYVVDAHDRLLRFNHRAAAHWGVQPRVGDDASRYWGTVRTRRQEGAAVSRSPTAEVLSTCRPAANREAEIEGPDGRSSILLMNIEPLRDDRDRVVGAINCFQDITDRCRAESELERSRRDLEDFFENGAVGLHLVAPDGTILKANRAELKMLGYPEDEYVGRSIREFHADPDVIADILRRLSAGESLDKYPARLVAKDGSIRHVQITSNVHFKDGEFLNTRCFTVDVTDWRDLETAKEATDRRFRATIEAAPVGVSETDADGRFIRVNPALSRITGYSQEELLRLGFAEITHPEDRENDVASYREQVSSKLDSYSIEKRYMRKDGEEIFVQVLSSAVRNAQGRFEYGVRIVQDITERRRAEARLAESERRARELLDGLPVAIYTTDAHGRITFYNEAAVEFSGRRPVLGTDSWCVSWRLYEMDGTPMPHDACPMATTLATGIEIRGAVAIAERPDGTRVPFMPFPKLLRGPDGNVVGAVNMLVDLSERQQAEEEQRALINELNHRVKNTLSAVQSIAAQTMRSTPDAFLEHFEARVMALSRAHNLLTRRRWTGVGLGELLEQQLGAYAGDDARLKLDGPEITLSPRVALLLGMLIHELITNAAKYGAFSTADGRVRLRWSVQNGAAGEKRLDLRWTESGGPVVLAPSKKGFGMRLLERSVVNDLGGVVDIRFLSTGVHCAIDFPVK